MRADIGEIVIPVFSGQIMLPDPLVIGDVSVIEAVAGHGESVGASEREAVQFEDLACCEGAEILRIGIGPEVLARACDHELARRNKREKPVLIDGHCILFSHIFLIVQAEPVREPVNDLLDALSAFSAGDRSAPAARIIRNDESKTLVEGAGHEGGLSETGMADHGDILMVDLGAGHEIIHDETCCPGPDGDLAGAGRCSRFAVIDETCDIVREIVVVFRDVVVAQAGNGETVVDDLLRGLVLVGRSALEIDGDKRRHRTAGFRDRKVEREGALAAVIGDFDADLVFIGVTGHEYLLQAPLGDVFVFDCVRFMREFTVYFTQDRLFDLRTQRDPVFLC